MCKILLTFFKRHKESYSEYLLMYHKVKQDDTLTQDTAGCNTSINELTLELN